jgi:TfoX/Sxy family transcriptional regulator of competence genes
MDEKTLFAILDRLENVFGVDVSEARQLTGEALKNWVDQAEEALFQSLLVDLQKPEN